MAKGERIAVSNTILVSRISSQTTHKSLSSFLHIADIALLLGQ